MTDKTDDWELFENTSNTNTISEKDLAKLLEKIQQTNNDSNAILETCKTILESTLILQKTVEKIRDSIQIKGLYNNENSDNENSDNIDNLDNKLVRKSNRVWRMYGNSYTTYTPYSNILGFNPNPLTPIKKSGFD